MGGCNLDPDSPNHCLVRGEPAWLRQMLGEVGTCNWLLCGKCRKPIVSFF